MAATMYSTMPGEEYGPKNGRDSSLQGVYDENEAYYNENNSNPNSQRERKSRRVTFYKNGDKYFPGKLITITPSRYYSFRELMGDLNRSVDLPYGVRRVYTPVSGREIYDIDELTDGASYVAASFEPFRPAKYGDPGRSWNPCKFTVFFICFYIYYLEWNQN